MDRSRHVVIIGCGFTGTTAFWQLVEQYPVERITVFEAGDSFGPGFPYRMDESREYLINNTNDTMCLEPGNRQAFLEWLQVHQAYSTDLDPKGHMPRSVYGEFLSDVIASTRALAQDKGIETTFVEHECTDIKELENGRAIVYWDGGNVEADMVILATGRCPERDVFGLSGKPGYFPTHMPGGKLDALPPDSEVHVIGASLSAYDVVNQLFGAATGCSFLDAGGNRLEFRAGSNERQVVLCSRSGRLQKVQSRFPFPLTRENFSSDNIRALPTRNTTLSDIWKLVLADAGVNGVGLDQEMLFVPYANCHDADELTARAAQILAVDIDMATNPKPSNFIVDYLDHAQFDIWDLFASNKLTDVDEARYRREFESALLACAAPCPVSTAQKILALMEAGRLRIINGCTGISQSEQGFRIEHAFGSEKAEYVVNATGVADRLVSSDEQPELIRNLSRRRLLCPYELEDKPSPGAAVDMDTLRAAGSNSIYVANMFLWGPGSFTSSAIMMATIVDRMLDAMFADTRDC
jgi:uncharacterized NAD(P)/FAD-binding protein YdhS